MTDLKSELVGRLERLNHAVLHKLEGLTEYDLRRPMTPTATNLLGVVLHLASLQAEYFGETFGRPFPRNGEIYFLHDDDADPQDDLWVRPQSSSDWVAGLYRDSWKHATETFAALGLEARGQVPTSPYAEVTLGEMLVHMVDETARHAGHLDIVRELIDGAVGRHDGDGNIIDGYDWAAYRQRVEDGAREAQARAGRTDRAGTTVDASPDQVFAALVDEGARTAWLPPDGMSGRFTWFDATPGGGYRLALTYDDAATVGKSGAGTDVVEGRFVDIEAPRLLVEEADFVSDDPALAGTMTMTWSLEAEGDATVVTLTATGVPPGIAEEDHLSAFASTLGNLATYVAGRDS